MSPTPLVAGSICRCRPVRGYAVVLAPPTPGRGWLTVMPLGHPPEYRMHPLRPELHLKAVRLLNPAEETPSCLRQAPLLLGDRVVSVATEDLDHPVAEVSAEQLHRIRQLGALALGLRPSDLRQPPSLRWAAW